MSIKERLNKYFRSKSPIRITADILFYVFILAAILPFSRKYLMTAMNKATMMRPAIVQESRQTSLSDKDYRWMLADLDGVPVSFNSFRDDVVFLSFWATWCPPCRAELPNIQRLYDNYGDQITMVLASNEESSVLRTFMAQHGYTFPVYRFMNNPPDVFRSGSIPTTFLVTPEGRISVRKTGAARWDGKYFTSYLDDLLE